VDWSGAIIGPGTLLSAFAAVVCTPTSPHPVSRHVKPRGDFKPDGGKARQQGMFVGSA